MNDTCVQYRLVDLGGHTIVCGQLFLFNGSIVHNIEYYTLLCWKTNLMVSIKLARIEENYKNLMDSGLITLAALV